MTVRAWNITIRRSPALSLIQLRLGKMAAGKLLKMLGEELQEDMQPLNYQVVLRESTQ